MGCCKAYRRRMEHEPSLEAQEHRRLDIDRLEELYLSLQPRIKKGDSKAIEVAARILMLKSKIISYQTPSKIAGGQGLERENGRNKEIPRSEWDDTKTISMYEEAMALLGAVRKS
jgi:hypothetical protein